MDKKILVICLLGIVLVSGCIEQEPCIIQNIEPIEKKIEIDNIGVTGRCISEENQVLDRFETTIHYDYYKNENNIIFPEIDDDPDYIRFNFEENPWDRWCPTGTEYYDITSIGEDVTLNITTSNGFEYQKKCRINLGDGYGNPGDLLYHIEVGIKDCIYEVE